MAFSLNVIILFCKGSSRSTVGNLCGMHSFKFSGLANGKVLNIASKKNGQKESVVIVKNHKKASCAARPGSRLLETGLSKKPTKGAEQISKAVAGAFHRRDLLELAQKKYT